MAELGQIEQSANVASGVTPIKGEVKFHREATVERDGRASVSRRQPLVSSLIKTYPQFYQDVWRACARIPAGEVRTYGWIAEQIGRPRAARAVGQALAANPFAPTIPCHRVVRSDGGLGGYSGPGGRARKARLLQLERQAVRKG